MLAISFGLQVVNFNIWCVRNSYCVSVWNVGYPKQIFLTQSSNAFWNNHYFNLYLRGLWINASPRECSLSEFRIWKGCSPWGNRGSVACYLLRMKTSATHPQPQVASQHLNTWTWYVNQAPQSLAHCHAGVVWWAATGNNTPCRVPGANPGPSAWQACDLPLGHVVSDWLLGGSGAL